MVVEELCTSDHIDTIRLDCETSLARDVILVLVVGKSQAAQDRCGVERTMVIGTRFTLHGAEERDAIRQCVHKLVPCSRSPIRRGRCSVAYDAELGPDRAESLLVDPELNAAVL